MSDPDSDTTATTNSGPLSLASALKLITVSVKFGADKRGTEAYTRAYGSKPNRESIYDYKAFEATGIKKGDFVVVETPSFGKTVVEVIGVDDTPITMSAPLKWIIGKVETTKTDELREKWKKAVNIIRVLDSKMAKKQQEAKYVELLADDSEAVDLLNQLKELQVYL